MMWKRVADNIDRYKTLPAARRRDRRQGLHPRAPVGRSDARSRPRSCAAASSTRARSARRRRACTSRSRVWDAMKDELVDTIASLKVGDVSDFSNFMGAVIKQGAFDKHAAAIAEARETRGHEGVRRRRAPTTARAGSSSPTLLTTEDPSVRHMREEFFGPIVTLHVYPDGAWDDTLAARRPHVAVRADRRGVRARPRARSSRRRPRCATRPATSTSTTSRPARSSASSRSAARARRAPTTRPARR